MIWPNAVADLRSVLSDGPTDKLRYRKKVIGDQDGTNTIFKTFEMRRVSNFTTPPTAPVGVYVNNAVATVTNDDLASGEFELASAPTDGDTLVATYYVQWFIDDELELFLRLGSSWAGFGDAYLETPVDFQRAVVEYAAFQAYQKLVSKFSENLAETYQLYDAPDEKRFNPVDVYMKIAKQKLDIATKLRDDVYERKGQAKAPRSATLAGRVRDVPPNR